MVAAYSMLKCEEVFAAQSWSGTLLTPVQRSFATKYPVTDFHFWVMYGSWSWCKDCGSFFFNDKYFSESVYQDQVTSATPDLLAPRRRQVPSDPVEHGHGRVGVSSRWWYLRGMYKPVQHCERCTKPARNQTAGAFLTGVLRRRQETHARGSSASTSGMPVVRTGQLYRIPRIRAEGAPFNDWSNECITWPRYKHGGFDLHHKTGDSMLDLSEDERRSLQIVVLRTDVKAERYGASHQLNWTKVGLSRAYFKKELVTEESMPTPRAAAAFRFLMAKNRFFRAFQVIQKQLITTQASLNISSYDLFVVHHGIECAMFPHLYPTTDFTDSGILQHYQHEHADDTNRVCSIGLSWTRKVLSSVRVYGEQRDLPFFLYEKHLANKFFNAHNRAKRMGVTGDVMTRDSQASSGYWDIVQDSLADLVRIMLVRCYDEENYPLLSKRGDKYLNGLTNLPGCN